GHARLLASLLDNARQFPTYGIGKGDVGHDSAPEESIDAMARAIEELVGNHELKWLVIILQRPYRRHRNDPLDSQLLEAMSVRAEIQFTGENAMSARVPRQKRHFPSLQQSANVGIGRRPERR